MSGSEKAPLFYISSWGGTATAWLATALSIHPDIVCFHGTRSIPPTESGINDISPAAFMDGLVTCARGCMYQKVFGAVHGYYGLSAWDAVKERNGYFGAIVRNPIKRIHSLYSHYYYDHYITYNINPTRYQEDDIYRNIVNNKEDYLDLDDRFEENSIAMTNAEKVFYTHCNGTVKYDMHCINNLDESQIFIMEKFTSDRDYFKNMFCMITSGKIYPDDEYIDKVFSFGKSNTHAKFVSTSCDIYDKWPESFKLIYMLSFDLHGGERVSKAYATLGYEIPKFKREMNLLGRKIILNNSASYAEK